jgi:hypothetical protein
MVGVEAAVVAVVAVEVEMQDVETVVEVAVAMPVLDTAVVVVVDAVIRVTELRATMRNS